MPPTERVIRSALAVQLQTPEEDWVDVGVLYNFEEKNWFEFSTDYWNLANRPILGQIFEETGQGWRPSANIALPKWFSHLLPEGRLRDAVAAAAHVNRVREFNLLARIGADDLPGAIRLRPTVGIEDVRTPPEYVEAENRQDEADPLTKFSLAGAQMKFSVYSKGKGLTLPVKGQAGNAIAKLPDNRPGFTGVPESEHASLLLAARAGIEVPSSRLERLSSIAGLEEWAEKISDPALVIDRFDRAGTDRRVHMEELAQVLNISAAQENAKYRKANFETVGTIIGALCGVEAVGLVIDRIVFNILIGNGDAHLKNWAILYQDGTTPSLSPMYDVLPTVLYIPSDDMGLRLSGSHEFESVQVHSFDRLAQRSNFGVDQARRRVTETVQRIVDHWAVLEEYLSAENYDWLTRRRDSLPILRDMTG